MGLLTNLALGLVHLFLVATDMLFLLLLVRVLSLRWPTPGLLAFNSVGRPVVDWFNRYVDRMAQYLGSKPLSQKMQLFISMLFVCLIRVVVIAVAK